MAYFLGNFIHGTALKLQYRIFPIPWVTRNKCISCCTKGREYSSSFPVKYIPNKSSNNEENEAAASVPVRYLEKRHNGPELNAARVDFSKNSSRSFLDVDSKYHDACRTSDIKYGLNLEVEEEIEGGFMALNDEFIEEPDEIVEDSSKSCGIQSGHSRQDVEKLAIELLASRAFTALELKKKLQGKRFPLEIVDAVITDFQSRGLINDCLYAETYSRSRWSSSSWGPRRIRQALFKRG
ncbi:hypothetical protein Pfo_013437 [Paulownia fortunei]|nr:hypothetical protein Pfo_013437 [Paulownia fortunei]